MSWRKIFIAVFSIIALARATHAAVDLGFVRGDGGQPGSFLDQPVSAREVGVGEAFTAIADDASALHANAAGMVQLDRPDVVSLYSSLYEDTAYGSAMYAQPLKSGGALGVGMINMNSKNYQKTDINRDTLGTYSESATAFYLAHARMWHGFGIGGTLKLVQQRIDVYSGSGYGADLSGFWPASKRLAMGLNLQNVISPSVQLKSTSESYARSLQVGARYRVKEKWLVTGDLQQTQQRTLKPLIGTEFGVGDVLTLRGGLNERELSMGIGFNIGQWTLDYAMGLQGALVGQNDLGTSHRFGLHFVFATNKPATRISYEEGPTRGDVKAVLGLLQQEVEAADVSTPTASHLQSLEKLVKETIGVNRQSMPIEILQADGQMKLLKGDIGAALPALVYAARILSDDATQQQNLQRALSRISPETKAEWAAHLMGEAQDVFDQGQYTDAASKSLVSFALVISDKADTLNKRARLALLSSMDLRQTTITDALLKDHIDEAYDRALSAFQLDPLNSKTLRLLEKVRAAIEMQNQKYASVSANKSITESKNYLIVAEQLPQSR